MLPYTALIGDDGRLLRQKIGPFAHGEIDGWVAGALADARGTFPETARHLAKLFTLDSLRTAVSGGATTTTFAVYAVVSAYELHQAWPEAEMVIVPDAGHSVFEPGLRQTLVTWMNELRSL